MTYDVGIVRRKRFISPDEVFSSFAAPAAAPASAWQTAFVRSPAPGMAFISTGWVATTQVMVFAIAEFARTGGTKMRLTLTGCPVAGPLEEGTSILEMWIYDGSGANSYAFGGTPTQVTVLGATAFLIPIGGSLITDEIPFGKAASGNLVVALYLDTGFNDNLWAESTNTFKSGSGWFFKGGNEASTVAKTGYTTGGDGTPSGTGHQVISKIEVYTTGGYLGVGDVSSYDAWWGLRAYSKAIAGTSQKLVNVFDVTQGSNTYDLTSNADGSINLAPLTGITGHTFHVTTWYDQTGNGRDLTQATDANRPAFTFSGLNSNPVVDMTNTSTVSMPGIYGGASQPWSLSIMTKKITQASVSYFMLDGNVEGFVDRGVDEICLNNATSGVGSTEVLAADHSWNTIHWRANGPTSSKYILNQSSLRPTDSNTDAWTGGFNLGEGAAAPAYVSEIGFKAAAIADATLQDLAHNQACFYGPFPKNYVEVVAVSAEDNESAGIVTSASLTTNIGTDPNALVAMITFNNSVTGLTVTWDSGGTNQTMTQIGTFTEPGATNVQYFYGLLSPTPGNKTLALSWTNGRNVTVATVSFRGVNSSFGSAFNFQSTGNPADTGPGTVVWGVVSAASHIPIAQITMTGSSVGSTSGWKIFTDNTVTQAVGAHLDFANDPALNSKGFSTLFSSNTSWGYAAVDVRP